MANKTDTADRSYVPARAHRKTASPWLYAHGCRCEGCREAWRKYQRVRKGLDPKVRRSATNRGRPPKDNYRHV